MIRLLMIIFFSIGCSVLNAQSTLNTKEFFPIIDSSYKELFQKIQITSEDSIQFVYHSYEYINISNNQYLISKTFDSDSLLTTYLKEEITPKGLKFVTGKNIEYDSLNNPTEFIVKGKRKITFPFKPIDKMSNWKSKFKNTFDNKVIVNSTIEFIGLGTLNSNGKEIELMNFKRIVNVKYKNDYLKEKDYYEYIWSFAKGQGLFKYVRIGELSLEGIIIKNELKK